MKKIKVLISFLICLYLCFSIVLADDDISSNGSLKTPSTGTEAITNMNDYLTGDLVDDMNILAGGQAYVAANAKWVDITNTYSEASNVSESVADNGEKEGEIHDETNYSHEDYMYSWDLPELTSDYVKENYDGQTLMALVNFHENQQLSEAEISELQSLLNLAKNNVQSLSVWEKYMDYYGLSPEQIVNAFNEKHNSNILAIEIMVDGTHNLLGAIGLPDGFNFLGKNATLLALGKKDKDGKFDFSRFKTMYSATTRPNGELLNEEGWKWGHETHSIYTTLKNKPKASASVSSKQYNVGMAIPTDENINGNVSVDADIKYDIDIRQYVCNAGFKDVVANVTVTYDYTYKYINPKHSYCYGPKEESGETVCIHNRATAHDVEGEETGHATGYISNEFPAFSYSETKKYYDVPKSEIQGLSTLSMSGPLVNFTESKGVPDGPGPQVISNPVMSQPSLQNQYNYLSGSVSGTGTDKTNADNNGKAAAAAACQRIYEEFVKKAKATVKDAFTFSSASDVNYNYRGVKVTWTSYNGGKPSVNPMSASGSDIIPLRIANGTYTHTGTATYSKGYSTSAASNAAVVHAPVVCDPYIYVSEDVVYDDLIDKDRFKGLTNSKAEKQKNMQLDTIGEIAFADQGCNLMPASETEYKGYGSRTYNSKQGVHKYEITWGEVYDVQFPFDVYIQDVNEKDENGKLQKIKRTFFLKKYTWLTQMVVEWNINHPDDKIKLANVERYVEGYGKGVPGNNAEVITFVLPVWTEERVYSDIKTRVIAVNCTKPYNENWASMDLYNDWNNNYCELAGANGGFAHKERKENVALNGGRHDADAAKTIAYYDELKLFVFGKIYDLQINNSRDVDWLNKVWSQPYQRDFIVSQEFPFGQSGQNRNVAYRYAPKLGYTFSFNFKTKGRKAGQMEISVQPEGFYFVSKNGGGIEQVDLWYSKSVYDPKERYIKIDPSNTKDGAKLTTRITDAFLKVNPQEMADSGRIYEREFNMWGNRYGNMGPYHYENPVQVGKLSKLTLPHSLRLTYNNSAEYRGRYQNTPIESLEKLPKNVGLALYGREKTEGEIFSDAGGQDNLIGSVGRWYCGYTLPASTIAVKLGGDPNKNANAVLKNGYILVRMSILAKAQDQNTSFAQVRNQNIINGTTKDNTFTKDYLKYTGPEYLNATDGEEYGLDWIPTSGPNLQKRNEKYVPVLNNNSRQFFTYFEKEDFWVHYKDINKEGLFSKSPRKYKQVTFGKPQFEWLTGAQIKARVNSGKTLGDDDAYKYIIKYKLPSIKGDITGSTYAGAVAVFDADLRATQDYDLSGTH